MRLALDPVLLQILACPKDKGPLHYLKDEDTLYNPRLHLRYRVTEGIPVMLIEEAEAVGEAEVARIEAKIAEDGIGLTFEPPAGGEKEEPR